MSHLSTTYGSTLPYGKGRSYGDSCLAASDQLLSMARLNRFIHADWNMGYLKAEAGVTLEDILMVCLPRGWFLPVTPGTQHVTLGGSIANDVHGKNHHKNGTFGVHVRSFGLLRPDYAEEHICSHTENPELFAATIGGLGLTGIITWAEIQLIPVTSCEIIQRTYRFENLAEFFELSRQHDHNHAYSVSWVDGFSPKGRGILTVGDHKQGPSHLRSGGLAQYVSSLKRIPFTPPLSLITPTLTRLFNAAYYAAHKNGERIVPYEAFFYPLDGISHWNRLYGRAGFQQYQCVVPDEKAEEAFEEFWRILIHYKLGSPLAVLKRCGAIPSPGLLSFPLSGTSLALDFPQSSPKLSELFSILDTIVHSAGGRLYPAKDAHMSGEHFRDFYPEWHRVEVLRDPRLNSRFWQRVTKL